MDMGEKENIAPCQGYVGWADIESVEYKSPPRNAVKYVLRITLVGSSPRVWREIAKEDPDSEEAWEYYTWLGSKWNEKFFPAIDTAIALNELNYKT